MHRYLLLCGLVVSGCSSSKPKDVTIDELGVVITVPGSWSMAKRGDGVGISSGGIDGVILRHESATAKTIDEARKILIQGAKSREEKELPGGGFLFDYDTDFGPEGKPQLIREITSFVTTKSGTVSCQLQLQPDQDAAPIKSACGSMRAK